MQNELPKLNKDLEKNRNKNKAKKSTKITVGVAVLLLLLTLSYGYLEGIDLLPYRKQTASTKAAELKLTYTDCASDKQEDCAAINASLEPGGSVEKTFEVDNDGSKDIEYNIYLLDLTNTFKNDELVYKLENLNTGEVLIPETPVPYRTEPQNELILESATAKARTRTRYKLTITYLNKDYNQIENMDAEFSMKVSIELKQQFTITFDANGGEVSTTTKIVNYGEAYGELPEPTYEGYEFLGWFTEIDGGSEITSEKTVSIIEDQTLYAHWGENKVTSEQTLAHLGVTVNDGNPDFSKVAPSIGSYTDNQFSGSNDYLTMDYRYQTSYYTYSDTYTFNESTGTYTLVNPQICEYRTCYNDLINKYIATYYGSTSSTLDEETKLDSIYKVVSSTTNVKLYYIKSSKTRNYDYSKDGVYAMVDDYGTSYYYRGAVTNNYIKYGKNKSGKDMWWRIIRINGDGSLRIIYDGTQGYANGTNNQARYAITSQNWNTYEYDAKYIGWMYGGAQGEASTSKEQAQTNETDSDAKTAVDNWYKENIVDTGFAGNVVDRVFCNDRSIKSGPGYGGDDTYYGAYSRLVDNKNPRFTCDVKNDAFTVEETKTTNGALTYPVGLITADEIAAAGGVYDEMAAVGKTAVMDNKLYYLYKTGSKSGLSFTPGKIYNINAYETSASVFGVNYIGILLESRLKSTSNSFAPVINLSAEYVSTLIGDGSITNPFRDPSNNL